MPTTAECNAILAAFKELGGSATTVEIAAHTHIKKERITKDIHSMRKFRMLQVKQVYNHGHKHGFVFELVR